MDVTFCHKTLQLHLQSGEPQIHTLFNNISSLLSELQSMFVGPVLAPQDLSDIGPLVQLTKSTLKVAALLGSLYPLDKIGEGFGKIALGS